MIAAVASIVPVVGAAELLLDRHGLQHRRENYLLAQDESAGTFLHALWNKRLAAETPNEGPRILVIRASQRRDFLEAAPGVEAIESRAAEFAGETVEWLAGSSFGEILCIRRNCVLRTNEGG